MEILAYFGAVALARTTKDQQSKTFMFLLALIEDTVRIPPSEFDAKELEAIQFQINKKYSNRVWLSNQLTDENINYCVGTRKHWIMYKAVRYCGCRRWHYYGRRRWKVR